MKIHFTRNSVCIGDDCFDNSRYYEFDNQATWEERRNPIVLYI
jgi:hypothetical protein